jgi:hypothetical protein
LGLLEPLGNDGGVNERVVKRREGQSFSPRFYTFRKPSGLWQAEHINHLYGFLLKVGNLFYPASPQGELHLYAGLSFQVELQDILLDVAVSAGDLPCARGNQNIAGRTATPKQFSSRFLNHDSLKSRVALSVKFIIADQPFKQVSAEFRIFVCGLRIRRSRINGGLSRFFLNLRCGDFAIGKVGKGQGEFLSSPC